MAIVFPPLAFLDLTDLSINRFGHLKFSTLFFQGHEEILANLRVFVSILNGIATLSLV